MKHSLPFPHTLYELNWRQDNALQIGHSIIRREKFIIEMVSVQNVSCMQRMSFFHSNSFVCTSSIVFVLLILFPNLGVTAVMVICYNQDYS
jgi:hypothetical protein